MTSGHRLRLYDTLAREKRDFVPIDPAHVRMYVCGPTVYDFAHIGNARPVIVFDVLFRLLRHLYGERHVTYVRNITDVDDKINARAARDYPDLPLNEAIGRVTAATEAQFHEDVDALGCLRPTEEPRATEHIAEMRALIERLVARGHAYVADGHVLFDVPSMRTYGRLSRRSTDELVAGARVDVAPYKRGPMDFVLWKPSKPGEPSWPSPCGIAAPGRPGWHIECSAMSMDALLAPFGGGLSCDDPEKNVFDIHGGGIDLVFPHHENEIAQSCCALGTDRMANYWLHNGFLMVEGEKMSKSLGNFVTIRDVLKDWPGDVVRLNMLKTHYRQPIDWTIKRLDETRAQLFEWTKHLYNEYGDDISYEVDADSVVIAAMSDDLNSPLAIKYLQDMFSIRDSWGLAEASVFASTLAFFGFRNLRKPGFFQDGFEAKILASGPQIDRETSLNIQSYRALLANSAAFYGRSNAYEILASDYLKKIQKGVIVDINSAGTLSVTNQAGGQFDAEVRRLVDARAAAKAARDFAEADRIRAELAAMGVELRDGKDPSTGQPVTTWEVAR